MVMAEGSTTISGWPMVPGIITVRRCMAATSRLSGLLVGFGIGGSQSFAKETNLSSCRNSNICQIFDLLAFFLIYNIRKTFEGLPQKE
jgi:hypothetical protein